MFNSLYQFYRSPEWESLRKQLILQRMEENGGDLICEHCGKHIVQMYDAIVHHKIPLTEANVNDFTISLNPKNLMVVCHESHNEIHKRFGSYTRHIYIVYGPPCAGKSTFVKKSATPDDLVVDLNQIYQAISINDSHVKSGKLTSCAFQIRDQLIDMVRTRNGKWNSAFVVGGYPLRMDRERLANQLGAELVYISCEKAICLERAKELSSDYVKYVEDWFARYH